MYITRFTSKFSILKAISTLFLSIIILLSVFVSGCKKDLIFSKANVSFSVDTVLFDTVFTTLGSTTQSFRIYNNDKNAIKIDEIRLMGGENSPFRINIDGVADLVHTNITLPKEDSIYAFVQVKLDVNNGNLPLIVEDSIQFTVNGKVSYVNLAVWGQDAYFHYSDLNEGVWPNDKPHVIYTYAAVDSAKSLIIQPGTDIYLHKSALLYVYKGQLDIQGTIDNPVTFQGDRLESFYDDVSGQYYGIYFEKAQPSTINYAIIKNGTAGIHVFSEDDGNSGYTLEVSNTEIYNCSSYGIFNYAGGKVKGENLLVHSNGLYAYFGLEGGDYNFIQSHLLGYGAEAGPAVAIKNYFTRADGITYIGQVNEGTINNSIIYGNGEDLIAYDTLLPTGVAINYSYENNLVKMDNIPDNLSQWIGTIFNQNPNFINTAEDDFQMNIGSPAQDAGNASFGSHTNSNDILGNPRTGVPDIGAYEL